MDQLDGTGEPVGDGSGLLIEAPGVFGTVTARITLDPGSPGPDRDVPPPIDDQDLAALLHASGFYEHAAVTVDLTSVALDADPDRARDEGQTLVKVAAPGSDAAVLMISDEGEDGLITFHFPVARGPDDGDGVDRGDEIVFAVDPQRLATASHAEADADAPADADGVDDAEIDGVDNLDDAERLPRILRKAISVLAYKLGGVIVQKAGEHFAKEWENKARPYGVKRLVDDIGTYSWEPFPHEGWAELTEQRCLLLVHGIFGTIPTTFGDVLKNPAAYKPILDGYDTVLGFDHPTVSKNPIENATWFLDQLPEDSNIHVDVLCHSRGGLVARILAGEIPIDGMPTIHVDKIVFVGTPNDGTVLVEPDNLKHFVNRFINLLRFIPPGPWSTAKTEVQAVLEVVKFLGMNLEMGLPGLICMTPENMNELNTGDPAHGIRYAIGADFKPFGNLLFLLADLAEDDLIFAKVKNDVAVPQIGVGTVPTDPDFPTDVENTSMVGPGRTWHGSYFRDEGVQTKIVEYLDFSTPGA